MSHGKLMNDMEEAAERRIQAVEAETAVLRQALDSVLAVECVLTNDGTGNDAYEPCPGCYRKNGEATKALVKTTAGQSLLDELQQLRQREAGLKSFLGVLSKEMETFCEATAFAPDALDAALNTMHRWQGLIEAACKGTEANHNG